MPLGCRGTKSPRESVRGQGGAGHSAVRSRHTGTPPPPMARVQARGRPPYLGWTTSQPGSAHGMGACAGTQATCNKRQAGTKLCARNAGSRARAPPPHVAPPRAWPEPQKESTEFGSSSSTTNLGRVLELAEGTVAFDQERVLLLNGGHPTLLVGVLCGPAAWRTRSRHRVIMRDDVAGQRAARPRGSRGGADHINVRVVHGGTLVCGVCTVP